MARYRRFDVQRNYYYETHDRNGNVKPYVCADGTEIENITESQWKEQVLKEWSDFQWLRIDEALIMFHDRDINEDGTNKGLHAHGTFHTLESEPVEWAVTKFRASSQKNCQNVHSYVDSVRYLFHVSEQALNDCKTIYNPEDVNNYILVDSSGKVSGSFTSRDVFPFRKIVGTGADDSEQVLDVIPQHANWYGFALNAEGEKIELTVADIKERMSRKTDIRKKADQKDTINKYLAQIYTGSALPQEILQKIESDVDGVGFLMEDSKKYRDSVEYAYQRYLELIQDFYKKHSHNRINIFVSGLGESGKDTLAKAIARKIGGVQGYHEAPTRGFTTYDFAGDYKGERISYISDYDASCHPMTQFLNLFDPFKFSPASSRNKDKFYFPDYAVFTSSDSLESFIYQMFSDYAKKSVKLSNYTRNELKKRGSESDWLNAYMLAGCGTRFHEIRRRFALYLYINSGRLFIYVRNNRKIYESFAFSAPNDENNPFELFKVIPYDSSLPFEEFLKQCNEALEQVELAVKYYLELHGLQAPEEQEQPDFSYILDKLDG